MARGTGPVGLLVLFLALAACSDENGSRNQGSLADFHEWLEEVRGVDLVERVDSFALEGDVLSARLSDDAAAFGAPGQTSESAEVRAAYDVCFGISHYVFTTLNETGARAISVSSSDREVLVTREPTDDFCLVDACEDADEVGGMHIPPCREDI